MIMKTSFILKIIQLTIFQFNNIKIFLYNSASSQLYTFISVAFHSLWSGLLALVLEDQRGTYPRGYHTLSLLCLSSDITVMKLLHKDIICLNYPLHFAYISFQHQQRLHTCHLVQIITQRKTCSMRLKKKVFCCSVLYRHGKKKKQLQNESFFEIF